MNFLEKIGLLSGFDPQNKLTTLSYILKTLLAGYARVNNREKDTSLSFFSTNEERIARFLLPPGSNNVMLWTIEYTPKLGEVSDTLAMELKAKKITTQAEMTKKCTDALAGAISSTSSLPTRLHLRNPNALGASSGSPLGDYSYIFEKSLGEKGDLYKIFLDDNNFRAEGNYYFFVVYYEINGISYNGYVSNFQEKTGNQDRSNYLSNIAEYVKYLSSGNNNYGEYFTVHKRELNSISRKIQDKEQINKNTTSLRPG